MVARDLWQRKPHLALVLGGFTPRTIVYNYNIAYNGKFWRFGEFDR